MNITRATIYLLHIGGRHPVLVEVETDEGIRGVGEAAVAYGTGGTAMESMAADILQPDIGNTGGILETRKIAAMAEAYSLRVQPHVCASPVSTAAALQLDACITNFLIQEIYPYRVDAHYAVVDHAPENDICSSWMPVPQRPGLGVELVPERVRGSVWAECDLRAPAADLSSDDSAAPSP